MSRNVYHLWSQNLFSKVTYIWHPYLNPVIKDNTLNLEFSTLESRNNFLEILLIDFTPVCSILTSVYFRKSSCYRLGVLQGPRASPGGGGAEAKPPEQFEIKAYFTRHTSYNFEVFKTFTISKFSKFC